MTRAREYFPELEGIRAYAFIVVFVVHASFGGITAAPTGSGLLSYLYFVLSQIAWAGVPIFFVLSGFLITGILYDSRDRQGFFRVFYGRRALRILPLYYLIFAIAAVCTQISHARLQKHQLFYLVYLQNMPGCEAIGEFGNLVSMGHLWSLAVEEQFYLLWPVAIWAIRDRISLLRLCYVVTALAVALRLVWIPLGLPGLEAYAFTPTRCDALMLGSALALHFRKPGFQIQRLAGIASWVAPIAVAVFYARVFWAGNGLPFDFVGVAFLTPLINLISLCAVILCLSPGTFLNRVCKAEWAVSLGKLSYGLYLFHYLFLPYMLSRVVPALKPVTGGAFAHIVPMVFLWSTTYALAKLSYRYIEEPTIRLKSKLKYGSSLETSRQLVALVPNQDTASIAG